MMKELEEMDAIKPNDLWLILRVNFLTLGFADHETGWLVPIHL